MNMSKLTTTLLAAASLFLFGVAAAPSFGADLTPERVAELYEKQWSEVDAMRIEFEREVRTRTRSNSYNNCSWEIVGGKAKVVEPRFTTFPSVPSNPDSKPITANVVSECYYDGLKTYELAEPADEWPMTEVKLSSYERLRRRGQRAVISNRNKHWRFWYSCPIPRYFSIPTESEVLSLSELVAKYDSSIVRQISSSQGDNIVQLEIHNNDVVGRFSSMIKSWALYISFNVDKNYAVSGYQLSVTLARTPEEKIITEYSVGRFKEFANSIWLPATVEYREHSGGVRSALTQITIRGVSINVPSEDFDDFHFLPGMVVSEEVWSDDEEETRPTTLVHVWGSSDEPERTFGSLEDFTKFFHDNFGDEPLDDEEDEEFHLFNRRRSALLFFVACFCLVSFAVLVFYLHRAVKRDEQGDD